MKSLTQMINESLGKPKRMDFEDHKTHKITPGLLLSWSFMSSQYETVGKDVEEELVKKGYKIEYYFDDLADDIMKNKHVDIKDRNDLLFGYWAEKGSKVAKCCAMGVANDLADGGLIFSTPFR